MARVPRPVNEQLRGLITESGVSHKGLARRVVDLGTLRGVPGLNYDHSSVSRWVAGEQPREPVPELIAEVFSVLLERRVSVPELGMTAPATSAGAGLTLAASWDDCVTDAVSLWKADVERRRFLRESAMAGAVSSAVALAWLVSPPVGAPARVGRRQVGEQDIAAIGEVVRSYRELDNRLGGGKLRGQVVEYLNTEVAPVLTQGRFTGQAGRRLAVAASELAQLAGWMAYDGGLHGHAQRYLTLALSFARHGGEEGLGAEILAAKAHQAVWLGQPAQAVDLARAAQATARRAGLPTLLAECHVMEAHGHAACDDARACAAALSAAAAAFERSARDNDPAWLRYFDEAYLAARMAHCFRALGDPALAARYARQSLDMDGRYVRGKAFNLSLLATALADKDEIEHACAIGAQALTVAAGLRSARSVRYIKDLQRSLRRRADAPAVRQFTARVAELLPAAAVPAGRR